MMTDDVRTQLLEAGIKLFREQGYHGTSVRRIAKETGIPKGSFCYYFKSKEDLAAAVIARYAQRSAELLLSYSQRLALSPANRLRAFFSETVESSSAEDFRCGCTIANLLAEIGDTNERLLKDLQHAWETMIQALTVLVAAVKQDSGIAESRSATAIAQHLLSSWEGALIAMRAQQSTQPLEQFITYTLEPLLG